MAALCQCISFPGYHEDIGLAARNRGKREKSRSLILCSMQIAATRASCAAPPEIFPHRTISRSVEVWFSVSPMRDSPGSPSNTPLAAERPPAVAAEYGVWGSSWDCLGSAGLRQFSQPRGGHGGPLELRRCAYARVLVSTAITRLALRRSLNGPPARISAAPASPHRETRRFMVHITI